MRVTINGNAIIVQENVMTSNGIIHAVNAIIPIPPLVTFVMADPNLYNMGMAFTRSNLTVDFPLVLSTENGSTPAPFIVLVLPIRYSWICWMNWRSND
jgi:transforming growth factor-beta-induced protein